MGIERVSGPLLAPEVDVLVDGIEVADGTGTVDFGTTVIGTPLARTITVANVGTLDVVLGTIALPADFSLLADFGTTLLAPGQTTDFVIQFDAVSSAQAEGIASFDSNDADENPYDFTVKVPESDLISQLVAGVVGLLLLRRFRSSAG